MEINTQQNVAAGALTTTESDTGATAITSDFETFLKMLTVQMQNQDPLNPIESSDYAVQLATFSGVEQQVQTNDLLRNLATQMTADGLSQLSSWVGMEARTTEPVSFTGTPVTLDVRPDPAADDVELIVYDSRDVEVQRLSLSPGRAEVDWAGVGSNGQPLSDGLYRFEVVSYALGDEIQRTDASSYAMVSEVQIEDGQSQLVLATGATVPTSAVTAVRDPALN